MTGDDTQIMGERLARVEEKIEFLQATTNETSRDVKDLLAAWNYYKGKEKVKSTAMVVGGGIIGSIIGGVASWRWH